VNAWLEGRASSEAEEKLVAIRYGDASGANFLANVRAYITCKAESHLLSLMRKSEPQKAVVTKPCNHFCQL
jgi:hypothetical protein